MFHRAVTTVSPHTRSSSFDPALEVDRIGTVLRKQVREVLRRRGVVVAMSGGVDSSVCAALAVHAVGSDAVLGLMLPEAESGTSGLPVALAWARALGIAYEVEDITATLEAIGCYQGRDAAIRRVVPDFGPGWRCKLVRAQEPSRLGGLHVFRLVAAAPEDEILHVRLGPHEYRAIVAATSFKQRVRKMVEYYHADRLHYAVAGTPNRLEYDQGFFVKGGDGLADVKPIAHLYKSQIYEIAEYLGVPERVLRSPPTTDTYSLPQTQEEFFFRLPLRTLDGVLRARNAGQDVETTALELGMTPEDVRTAFLEIDRRRRVACYLHAPPLLVQDEPRVTPAAANVD